MSRLIVTNRLLMTSALENDTITNFYKLANWLKASFVDFGEH